MRYTSSVLWALCGEGIIKGIEMMKIKKDYESPSLSLRRIELESGFCGASSEVTNPDKASGRIDEHSINTGFGGDFSGSEWDTDPTGSAN